jgi:hypothetical protein
MRFETPRSKEADHNRITVLMFLAYGTYFIRNYFRFFHIVPYIYSWNNPLSIEITLWDEWPESQV